MGLTVFFCYDRLLDIQRAKRIKHRYEMKGGRAIGFPKPNEWKKIKKRGEQAIRYWVEDQVHFSDVTAVLIGENTSKDPVVRQAIIACHQLEKGLLGIYIHNIRSDNGRRTPQGPNPFDNFCVVKGDQKTKLSEFYPTYDWIRHTGHFNLNQWITKAAQTAWNPFSQMTYGI
ncbi:MAG: TIR domain-containing protein [Desulfobacteraceae bacterium]|jgi:hypothetical protein